MEDFKIPRSLFSRLSKITSNKVRQSITTRGWGDSLTWHVRQRVSLAAEPWSCFRGSGSHCVEDRRK